jgi:hypothetical protein
MKTKREVLEEFAKNGDCENINCKVECPYCFSDKCLDLDLRKIGAMAILRMFPEKKNPLLSIGKKVRFDDGSIAEIVSTTAGPELSFHTINGYTSRSLSYLLGRTWEVVE